MQLYYQVLGPGLACSKGSVSMSPSLPPHSPIPASCQEALLSVYGQVCVEGNFPGNLARAQLFAEHLTQDLIPG